MLINKSAFLIAKPLEAIKMENVELLKRVFILDQTRIADPLPGVPLKQATRVLAQNYPQFRWTNVLEEDGVLVNGVLEFKLVLPPPKVNG